MRALAIDFGGKHIGVASGDDVSKLCSPRKALAATGTLAKDALAIQKVMIDEDATVVVVGLPLDANGETKMSKICRQLGGKLSELGVHVKYVDESLTSLESETAMLMAGLKGSQIRKNIDSEAACRILERFWETNGKEA